MVVDAQRLPKGLNVINAGPAAFAKGNLLIWFSIG